MVKMKVKELKKLEDGVHKGIIVDIEERFKPYEYVDLIIESEGVTLKAGFPSNLNPISNLGKLLLKFGITLKINSEIDIDVALKGKNCIFQTMTEERDGMTFAKIIPTSIKPDN